MDKSQKAQLVLLIVLLAAMAGIVGILAQFYQDTAELRTLVVPGDVFACHRDDDCGLANHVACCPCEASGGQAAVNKLKREQLKTFLQAACTEAVPCVEVDTCRDDVRPRCADDRCSLVPMDAPPRDGDEGS